MRASSLILFSALLATTAHGAVQHFAETRELDSVREKLDRATVRFQVLEERENRFEIPHTRRFIPLGKREQPVSGCSGVFISETGYLLTAQHCLVYQSMDYSLFSKLENTRFDDYKRQFKLLSSFNFRLRIWTSSIFGRFSKDYDARIVASGPYRNVLSHIKGLPASSYRQLNEGLRPALEFIEKGYGVIGSDWVIVKVDSEMSFPCLKVGNQPAISDVLYRLGFPDKNPTLNNDGTELLISSGHLDPETNLNCIAKIVSKVIPRHERREFATDQDFEAYLEHLRLTKEIVVQGSLDGVQATDSLAYPGMSGGPTVNQSGDLVGITTDDANAICAGFSYSLDVRKIQTNVNYLRSVVPSVPSNDEFFSCSK